MSNQALDRTRRVTYWTNCTAEGTLVDKEVTFPESEVYSVESDLKHPRSKETKIRDICSLTKESTAQYTMDFLKAYVGDTKGDDSRGAVKVYSGSKNKDGSPKW